MAENARKEEISFYKPKTRFIIPIKSFHIPKKLFSEFKKQTYHFAINYDLYAVINNCSKARKNSETWINSIIKDTYFELYKEGYVKSIECYDGDKLIGGLYGVHIGSCFFGESMFNLIKNTSKLCLLFLISILKYRNFTLLDSQYYNRHLLQFGGFEIQDNEYQEILKKGLEKKCFFPKHFNIQESFSILQSINHIS